MNALPLLSRAPLFAADALQVLIPLIAIAVWVIAALSRNVGQLDAGARPPVRPQPARPSRQASQAEFDQFLREYGGQATPATVVKRPERKKPAAAAQAQAKQQTVAQRRFRSDIESRQTRVVHSRLEDSHLQPHVVAEEQIRQDAIAAASGKLVYRRRRVNSALAALLTRPQVGRAFILGQVLQSPPGLADPSQGPLGPPLSQT
jgi:hypothetical protein